MYKRGDVVEYEGGKGKIIGFYPKTQDVLVEGEDHSTTIITQSSIIKVFRDEKKTTQSG